MHKKQNKKINKRKLYDIIREYWEDFQEKKNIKCVIKKSIPIIWFGDIEKYWASKIRVVTVAINPSLMEFKEKKKAKYSFLRFPDTEKIYDKEKLGKKDKDILYNSLNQYFDNRPYKKWFGYFESFINSFNTSYSGKEIKKTNKVCENTAIHIDMYSALATSPTWGIIKKKNPEIIKEITNLELFKELIKFLNYDIIICSVRLPDFEGAFVDKRIRVVCNEEEGKHKKLKVYKKNNKLIIFGSNNQGNPLQGKWFSDKMKKFINENQNKNIGSKDVLKKIKTL